MLSVTNASFKNLNTLLSSENRMVDGCKKYGWTFSFKTRSCYKFINNPATWLGASNTCWREGGHLATMDSHDENKLVFDMAHRNKNKLNSGTNLWVGSRRNSSSAWQWVDGNQNSYTNWDSGQPDNKGGNQFCAMMQGWHNIDKWDDRVCTEKQEYVCKTPLHGKFFFF